METSSAGRSAQWQSAVLPGGGTGLGLEDLVALVRKVAAAWDDAAVAATCAAEIPAAPLNVRASSSSHQEPYWWWEKARRQ
jgi:hypothetical protein